MDAELRNKSDSQLNTDIDALELKKNRIETQASNERRSLSVSEASLVEDIGEMIKDIRAELKMRAPEKRLTLQGPGGDGMGHGFEAGARATRGRDFRAMFGHKPNERLDTGGFESCAEFLQVFNSGRYDPRLQVRASMGESIPSSGGFSVPDGFSSEWLDASLPNEIVRNLCRVYPMTSESLQIPGWDGADMSAGATHGGLTMEFLDESGTAVPQAAKMRKVQLTARMAGIYVDASVELLQDGKNFEANLEIALRQSLGYGIDRYCIAGTGAGQPLGILNSPCKIAIAKEAGQKADTIIYSNLKKMFARQLNPERAVWLFNPSTIPELMEQSVAVGTAGSFVPLLQESSGKFLVFGRPVYFHPSVPALGDAGDSIFIDFNFYGLGLRRELWIDVTDAVKWLQRERSFRILMRFDGQVTLDKPITPEHGDTLSPVVTLAERA